MEPSVFWYPVYLWKLLSYFSYTVCFVYGVIDALPETRRVVFSINTEKGSISQLNVYSTSLVNSEHFISLVAFGMVFLT